MRSRIWLVVWIIGILFPMEFLARVWPAFGRVFNPIFSPDWVHIVMHTLLYSGLVFLLAQAISPISLKAGLFLVGLGLLVGCMQESLQLLSARAWPGWSVQRQLGRQSCYFSRSVAASWPHAPSISRPRVSRTVTGTPW